MSDARRDCDQVMFRDTKTPVGIEFVVEIYKVEAAFAKSKQSRSALVQ